MPEKNQKLAVIATVLNEAKSIESLLAALKSQTLQPLEVIIVDGGSTDETIQVIEDFHDKNPKFPLRLFIKKGNRSKGRNLAIQKAKSELIAITDAGCIPESNWLEELLNNQAQTQAKVVAGYYRGIAKTPFEEAVIPYALVMPDRVNPNIFLPATRSMLMTKKTWEEVGRFDEELSDNEDFAFAKNLEKTGIKITFAENAVVAWQPPSHLGSFYNMIYRFAKGDIYSGIVRPKVILIFLRYLIGLLLILFNLRLTLLALAVYLFWAFKKNKKYVPSGWYWLPVLQILSDFAVMHGSICGAMQKMRW